MAKDKSPDDTTATPVPPAAEAEAATATPPAAESAPAGPADGGQATAPAPAGDAAKPAAEAAVPEKKRTKKPGVAPRRGKKLRNHLRNIEKKLRDAGPMPLRQAITELKKMKRAKFDETVEVHMNLGIDVTQSDQMIRGAIPLPHGIGKTVRIAVFAQGEKADAARAAGADVVGAADLVERVTKENFLDFDVAIATQDMMGQVSRLGKVLGPRGLMPTPKAGTVVPLNGDVGAAVREFKAGKVEYRSDKTGQVHAGVGKMSFPDDQLVANITTFVEQVKAAKPTAVKGNFVNGVTLSATMSPGIRLVI